MSNSNVYEVHVIDDADLAAGVDWIFVRVNGCLQFWLRRSACCEPQRLERALNEGWEAYRNIAADALLSWPEPALVG